MPMTVMQGALTGEKLLERQGDPYVPSLENRVAYQWEGEFGTDLVGVRTSAIRNRVVITWLANALKRTKQPRMMLDVGCAYGNHILMLNSFLEKDPGITFVGVDLSNHGLPYANQFAATVEGYSNCKFMQADLEKGLPFADNQFDAVNFSDVIEHLPSPRAALQELNRVMKPGGILVISTPLKTSLFKSLSSIFNKLSGGRLYKGYYKGKDTELDENGAPIMDVHDGHDHISEMTYDELRRLPGQAGFELVEIKLMPIMSGSRWFDKHPFSLPVILFLEAIHDVIKVPSWAHAACLCLRKPLK